MNLRTIQVHVSRTLINEFKKEAREAFPKETFAYLLGRDAGTIVEIEELFIPLDADEWCTETGVEISDEWLPARKKASKGARADGSRRHSQSSVSLRRNRQAKAGANTHRARHRRRHARVDRGYLPGAATARREPNQPDALLGSDVPGGRAHSVKTISRAPARRYHLRKASTISGDIGSSMTNTTLAS